MLVLVVAAEVVERVGLGVVSVGAGVVDGHLQGNAPAAAKVLEEAWLLDHSEALNGHETSGLSVEGEGDLLLLHHVVNTLSGLTNQC